MICSKCCPSDMGYLRMSQETRMRVQRVWGKLWWWVRDGGGVGGKREWMTTMIKNRIVVWWDGRMRGENGVIRGGGGGARRRKECGYWWVCVWGVKDKMIVHTSSLYCIAQSYMYAEGGNECGGAKWVVRRARVCVYVGEETWGGIGWSSFLLFWKSTQ